MGLSLISFDTDHIKHYVFGTDKLKEIRGASSLLDYLNRFMMEQIAEKHGAKKIYAHGGSGLFYVATEKAKDFGKEVQRAYYGETGGGASITFATLPLPATITNKNIRSEDLSKFMEILQGLLQEAKLQPPDSLTLVSHPFIRLCDSCGIEYASPTAVKDKEKTKRDPGEEEAHIV